MNSVVPFWSLSDVIRGLRGSVGGWAVKGWLSAVLGLLVHRRLGEILGRMERLVARFEAGRLRPAGQGRRVVTRPPGERAERILPRDPTAELPRRFGWLVRAASWQAAGFGEQLRGVLLRPEMVALLEAAPQAVRVLTPLCRMLAVEVSLLRPGVAVEVPEPGEVLVKVKRVRTPRPAVDLGRIPIPRGVMTAVRRGRFLRGG